MKFIVFCMYDVAKMGEVAKASDKNAKIPGQKLLAVYACLGKAFDGVPPTTLVSISVRETESDDALAAALFNLTLAGATAWAVPVMEGKVGNTVAEVEKLQK
jgi:hypothetical protein